MKKLLTSIPDELDSRFRRKQKLFDCAVEIEQDEKLNEEMMEWETKTRNDGLNEELW